MYICLVFTTNVNMDFPGVTSRTHTILSLNSSQELRLTCSARKFSILIHSALTEM